MKYTVLWTEPAEQELADVWLDSTDRNRFSAAAHLIEQQLARDPDRVGDSSFDTVRTFKVAPLAIEFEVIEVERIVYVLSVWDIFHS